MAAAAAKSSIPAVCDLRRKVVPGIWFLQAEICRLSAGLSRTAGKMRSRFPERRYIPVFEKYAEWTVMSRNAGDGWFYIRVIRVCHVE